MPDSDNIDDILDSIEANDIIDASKFKGRSGDTASPMDISASSAVKMTGAFNNPGSGNTAVREGVTPEGNITDISMRAGPTPGGGQATWEDADGNIHSGPKFVPGDRRKKRQVRVDNHPFSCAPVGSNPPVRVWNIHNKDAFLNLRPHFYVVSSLKFPEGKAFRLTGGPFGRNILYLVESTLFDKIKEQGDLASLEITLETEEGFIVGGPRVRSSIDQNLIDSYVFSINKKWLEQEET
jgi:hypothetical protein